MIIGNVHINVPRIETTEVVRGDCPTCKKSRFFVRWWEEWYGPTDTCLKCGERWQGGEHCPRPFERGWRKQNIKSAKEVFRRRHKVDSGKTVANLLECNPEPKSSSSVTASATTVTSPSPGSSEKPE